MGLPIHFLKRILHLLGLVGIVSSGRLRGEGVCVSQAGVVVPGGFVATFTIHRDYRLLGGPAGLGSDSENRPLKISKA